MTSEAQFVDATVADDFLGSGLDSDQFAHAVHEPQRRTVIAFVGMGFEAKIAAGPGVLVLCRGARRELAALAATAAREGYRGIISFGVAGGLASHLRTGDWVVASTVLESETARETDSAWSRKLVRQIPGANFEPILGVDDPVAEPSRKRELHRTTGAVAVDMESHVVARLADAHGLAFAAVRVVIDPAERAIPPAALLGMNGSGRTEISAVLRDLVARPSQLPPLARLAVDAFAARAELQRVRRLLGPNFGLMDLT